MKAGPQQLLQSLTHASNAGWPYLVVRANGAALQCLALLELHGLLSTYGPLAPAAAAAAGIGTGSRVTFFRALPPPLRRLLRRSRRQLGRSGSAAAVTLLVWLRPWPAEAAGAATERSRLQRSGGGNATAAGFRLKLRLKPSRRRQTFLNLRSLRRRYAAGSQLGLLQTSQGVVSSAEALRRRLGGWLLAEVQF